MKFLTLACAAFFTALGFTRLSERSPSASMSLEAIESLKKSSALGCTPDRLQLAEVLSEMDIPLLPGDNRYSWNIRTQSDSARLYFNQGINAYYGFHIIESLASFQKAARFDPENPMVWWGQALAYGPNINDVEYKDAPEALAAARKAMELISRANPLEQSLIRAMSVRYSDDPAKNREILNKAYSEAMRQVVLEHPNSPEAHTLYADALMLEHPWDLWNPDATPRPWQPEIQGHLEKALELDPNNPGANHLYIHVVEASPYPEKALPSADRLGDLTPGLAHMVHMPSHIYLRTGQFSRGTRINEAAINNYFEYAKLFPAVTSNEFIYLLHNRHMQMNCAMMEGKEAVAVQSAASLQNEVDPSLLALEAPMGSFMQYLYMSPVLVDVLFENWDALLQMPRPGEDFVYANIIYHFGRGMALAATHQPAAASVELRLMETLMQDESLKIPMTPFSAAIEGAECARRTLEGAILLEQGQFQEAIAAFEKAVEQELHMVYNEPRDWLLNPRPYLAAAQLRARRFADAEASYRGHLKVHADNVWSLHGLQKALRMQGRKKEAANVAEKFKAVSKGSDVDFAKLYY